MTSASALANLLPARYRLLDQLGAGGMGAVFRAYDRLGERCVALKWVRLAPASADEREQLRLAFAHEFRVLAGLRHPQIISVLDYGFDAAREPFFTMELLDGAQTLLAAGHQLPRDQRVGLLLQALEALAYLHRRGVLHHDLKPANMLVRGGQLRLLDFGLAVLSAQQPSDEISGTLLYLAPEVLNGEPYSEAADLYSLGVAAYELLLGRHPFPAESTHAFLDQVRRQPPDLAGLAGEPALAAALGRLLAKDPAERPASAAAAIGLLRQAAGLPDPPESAAIRESYLQAAAFVGRAAELGRLGEALAAAAAGRGSAWLIGGESGVGKSRMLDELRAQALVAGFRVLRGQAVEGGGQPYQLWRDLLRPILIERPPSDLEAGVLKEVVPEIADLLGRPVPDPPALGGEAGRQRLVLAVASVAASATQPTVLVLEDLHWAREGQLPLRQLARLAAGRPLLVVGSFRDDEAPRLPDALPDLALLRLPRLSAAETAALSRSMLGDAAVGPALVELLQRETEGNCFFLVEVVRALAEEAGSLAQVQRMPLPRHVLAGGIQQVVRRRLARVPDWAQGALAAAAVAGREVDQPVLRALDPDLALDAWLRACADAAVLEVSGERWRFSHDQLREGLLLALSDDRRRELHARVLGAIERAYPADLGARAAGLAAHAAQAGDLARERRYALLAGERAVAQFATYQALAFLGRALELADPGDLPTRYAILSARERADTVLHDAEPLQRDLVELGALAAAMGDEARGAYVAVRRALCAYTLNDNAGAIALARAAVARADALGDQALAAEARLTWGRSCNRLGQYAEAQEQLELVRPFTEAAGPPALEAQRLAGLGESYLLQGVNEPAEQYIERALEIAEQVGDRDMQLSLLIYLGAIAANRDDLNAAEQLFRQALLIARAIGAQAAEATLLSNIAATIVDRDADYAAARPLIEQALAIAERIGAHYEQAMSLYHLAAIASHVGDYAGALPTGERALAAARQTDDQRLLGIVSQTLGEIYQALGRLGDAEAAYTRALESNRTLGNDAYALEPLAGLARVALARGAVAEARAGIAAILQATAEHDPGADRENERLHFICYEVLQAAGDPAAADRLARAYAALQARAGRIADPERRRALLEDQPQNRAVLAAWARRGNLP